MFVGLDIRSDSVLATHVVALAIDDHVHAGVVINGQIFHVESSRTEAVRRMSPRTVPKIMASTLEDEAAAIAAARAAMLQG